jgi:hypothetical protein
MSKLYGAEALYVRSNFNGLEEKLRFLTKIPGLSHGLLAYASIRDAVSGKQPDEVHEGRRIKQLTQVEEYFQRPEQESETKNKLEALGSLAVQLQFIKDALLEYVTNLPNFAAKNKTGFNQNGEVGIYEFSRDEIDPVAVAQIISADLLSRDKHYYSFNKFLEAADVNAGRDVIRDWEYTWDTKYNSAPNFRLKKAEPIVINFDSKVALVFTPHMSGDPEGKTGPYRVESFTASIKVTNVPERVTEKVAEIQQAQDLETAKAKLKNPDLLLAEIKNKPTNKLEEDIFITHQQGENKGQPIIFSTEQVQEIFADQSEKYNLQSLRYFPQKSHKDERVYYSTQIENLSTDTDNWYKSWENRFSVIILPVQNHRNGELSGWRIKYGLMVKARDFEKDSRIEKIYNLIHSYLEERNWTTLTLSQIEKKVKFDLEIQGQSKKFDAEELQRITKEAFLGPFRFNCEHQSEKNIVQTPTGETQLFIGNEWYTATSEAPAIVREVSLEKNLELRVTYPAGFKQGDEPSYQIHRLPMATN